VEIPSSQTKHLSSNLIINAALKTGPNVPILSTNVVEKFTGVRLRR
jgi:hypothetical protein